MRSSPLALLTLAIASSASAQVEVIFNQNKAPVFLEREVDRKFNKTGVARMLAQGTDNPNCMQLTGGLFTVLAEIGPLIHKRDETFSVDPILLQAATYQLNTQRFPGSQYLNLMVRRVLIEGRLPPEWLETATQLNNAYRIIDINKLRFLADGLKPIDSFYFTLGLLRERHAVEIERATRISNANETEFRDRYLDRDVTWQDMKVVDIGPERRNAGKKKGKGLIVDEESSDVIAELEWMPPRPEQNMLTIFQPREKGPTVRVRARLQPKQYIDLYHLPKNRAITVRGRLWDMNKTLTEFQIRDAILFDTRDWSQGTVLASPGAVAACPAAFDELKGQAPGANQPGGFGHR